MTHEKYMKFAFLFTKGFVGIGLAHCSCVRSLHAPWRERGLWSLTLHRKPLPTTVYILSPKSLPAHLSAVASSAAF